MDDFYAEQKPSPHLISQIAALSPANPFQTPSYTEARCTLGEEPWLLAMRDGNNLTSGCVGYIKSGHLNRSLEIISLPIFRDGANFYSGIEEFCRKMKITSLELNSFCSMESNIPRMAGEIWRTARSEYVLDLQSSILWESLSSNHSRNVKRSRRADVQLQRTTDTQSCRQHADLIRHSMARRQKRGERIRSGLEVEPIVALTSMGAGELFRAVQEDQVLSSILVLLSEKGAYYQSAGTSAEGMACGASHFLVYEIANVLRSQMKEVFNLGGADQESVGLQRFKAGFGSRIVPLESIGCYLGSRPRKWLSSMIQRLGG